MTEHEWNHSHPEQAGAYINAWQEKQKRETYRIAGTQLTIAQFSGNVKKGAKLTISDFLPDWAKPKKRKLTAEESENNLKAALAGMAKRKL